MIKQPVSARTGTVPGLPITSSLQLQSGESQAGYLPCIQVSNRAIQVPGFV